MCALGTYHAKRLLDFAFSLRKESVAGLSSDENFFVCRMEKFCEQSQGRGPLLSTGASKD